MDKKEIIKKLIAGGVAATIAGTTGVLCFNIGHNAGYGEGLKILPPGTDKILISVWNQVLEDKKNNCEEDPDCVIENGVPIIRLELEGSIKENFIKIMGGLVDDYEIKVIKNGQQ